jgi:regulatory protein
MADMQITALEVQKKNPNRVNVYLDGEFAFGLSRIVAAWLEPGMKINQEKINSLQAADTSEIVYQKALKLLDYRPRTEKEIYQRLAQKGYEPENIEITIDRLRTANLVQDGQFARMWVENRNTSHPRSMRLMQYELKMKGVQDVLIENALAESESDLTLAQRAAEKHARKLRNLEWLDFRKKLSAFLARRGFSFETINFVVRSVWENQEKQDTTLEIKDIENG